MAYNRPAEFIPEVWSSTILSRLNDALVFGQVVNRDYEGEITGYGDVVKINEIGPITVNSYSATSTGSLTVQSVSDAQKQLKIDQSDYFAFWIDDLDMAQTNPKLMAEAQKESGFSIAKTIDQYIAAMYAQGNLVAGGTSISAGQDITSTNVLKYMSIAAQKMSENNAPEMGRWMVVPPWFAQKLTLARIVQDTNNSATLASGYFGRSLYGFDVYISNNITNGTPAGDNAAIMFGYRGSISLAVQITKIETARPSMIGFKTLVKGLVCFGAKVVRPKTLGVLYADYTAEAT